MSRKVSKHLPAVLKVTNGAQAGVTVPLGSGILIGRSGDCQLILDDDYASTRHARLTLTPSGYQVEASSAPRTAPTSTTNASRHPHSARSSRTACGSAAP